MTERQEQMWDALCELDGETVARLFTDYSTYKEYMSDALDEFEDNTGFCIGGVYDD